MCENRTGRQFALPGHGVFLIFLNIEAPSKHFPFPNGNHLGDVTKIVMGRLIGQWGHELTFTRPHRRHNPLNA